MNNKTFLSLHSGIYTAFALALFLIPELMWPVYGVEINDQNALFLSQHTSIFLGGLAIISFMLRDIEPGKVAKNLFLSLLLTNLLGVIITFYGAVIGVFTGLGWSDPAFFMLLSILSFVQMKKQ
ncbi:MAG: hypothetical protein ACPG5L_16155 [Vibrio gallaecicus]|uniref:Uncharacterized protein n=1 Tax=Vibrio gallaecicus TaxID=552386 RepID=A0ABV4NEY9_9VIBR|nr:hypothetical protein [Vibrio gallaecicus]MDN3613245.1 hypothetical protein [Vibrio gallaecicus]